MDFQKKLKEITLKKYPICNLCGSNFDFNSKYSIVSCTNCRDDRSLIRKGLNYFEVYADNYILINFYISINNYNINICKNENITSISISKNTKLIVDDHLLSDDIDFDPILTQEEILSFIDNLIFI